MAIIDYVKGEFITPEGKKVKRATEGSVPTDQAVLQAPINAGGGNFYAPGFGSNQTLDYEFYADDPPPVQPDTPSPGTQFRGQPTSGGGQGNSNDAKQDDKSGAGAVPDLRSWAEAIMTGGPIPGVGSIVGAIGSEVMGKNYKNYNQTNPEAWDQAVKEGNTLYPGNPQLALAHANNVMKANEPGGGGAGDPNSPANNISSPGEAKAVAGTPGVGVAGDVISQEDIDAITAPSVNVRTASGPKPPGQGQGNSGGNKGPGKGTGSGTSSQGGNYSDARDDPGGGGNQGGGGGGGNKGAPGGSGEAPGGQGYEKGGYVSDAEKGVPTSMRQMYRRPAPATQAAAPQKPNGTGGYNAGGHVTKPAAVPSRTQRYMQSRQQGAMPQSRATGGFVAAQGFADGGMIPNQGYQDGGAVADDRFNPSPAAIADDGVIDNQPINADEGEYVIQRESADILGPEILNALNDPMMAKAFSDLFDAALGLDSGGSAEGASPAPGMPPKMPSMPQSGAQIGASLANDNGPEAPMPAFRKGGYVGKRR